MTELLCRRAVLVILFLTAVSAADHAWSHDCEFTPEQDWLLDAAYALGSKYDWGYTMAAIVWEESFWGDEVRRERTQDGRWGSYGVSHVLASTGLDMLEWDQTDENAELLIAKLVSDDIFAINMGLAYLMKWERRGWFGMIQKYNGRGEEAVAYAGRVIHKVESLVECGRFGGEL